MLYFAIAVFIVGQALWIAFLLLEQRRRTRLEAERQKTAEALRESESRNRAIIAALPDIVFVLDERGTYLDWYASDRKNLYVPPEQFLGKTIDEVVPAAVAQQCREAFQHVLASGSPARVEYGLPIEREFRFFETRIVRFRDRKLLAIARDITELKRAEIELQKLSAQMLSLQDEVSRRVARELHDNTAQHLFAISIQLANLRRMDSGISKPGVGLLDECRDLCESSLREVRTLSYLSHPPELEHTSLVSALRWYIDGFGKRTGIDVNFQAAPEMRRLTNEAEVDLFRVVQDCLFNVFRHSTIQTASVILGSDEDHVVLQIKGGGEMDSPAAEPVEATGISSIRDRLRRWGGELKVESNNEGPLLTAEVPFHQSRTAAGGTRGRK